jgi:hypothetical protein
MLFAARSIYCGCQVLNVLIARIVLGMLQQCCSMCMPVRPGLVMLAGIPCLFANLSVAAWIKFDKSLLSQLMTTIVLVLALVSMGYSRKWSAHILETERTELVRARVRAHTNNPYCLLVLHA